MDSFVCCDKTVHVVLYCVTVSFEFDLKFKYNIEFFNIAYSLSLSPEMGITSNRSSIYFWLIIQSVIHH